MIITEIFRSIQGESTHSGLPCIFVRLTGCNLRCTWCDTAYAFHGGTKMSIEEILSRVEELSAVAKDGQPAKTLPARPTARTACMIVVNSQPIAVLFTLAITESTMTALLSKFGPIPFFRCMELGKYRISVPPLADVIW